MASIEQLLNAFTYRSLSPTLLDPAHTALVLVDVQVDFAAPDGLMGKRGLPLQSVDAAVERMRELLTAARTAGVKVAFVRVVTRPGTDSENFVALMRGLHFPLADVMPGIEGTPGAEYYKLIPEPGEADIRKPWFDSFHETDLDTVLRGWETNTLVIAGVTTDCCVGMTVRAAFHRGYRVVLPTDASACYDEQMHHSALPSLIYTAMLTDSSTVISAWTSR
jgi:biuret amidohydrolase